MSQVQVGEETLQAVLKRFIYSAVEVGPDLRRARPSWPAASMPAAPHAELHAWLPGPRSSKPWVIPWVFFMVTIRGSAERR